MRRPGHAVPDRSPVPGGVEPWPAEAPVPMSSGTGCACVDGWHTCRVPRSLLDPLASLIWSWHHEDPRVPGHCVCEPATGTRCCPYYEIARTWTGHGAVRDHTSPREGSGW